MRTLADRIDSLARTQPDAPAFLGDAGALSWREYAERTDRFAAHLASLGLLPGERVAVLLPDGPGVHVAYVACEKAGLIVTGIGPRAGREEIRHLLAKSGAAALVSRATARELDLRALFAELAASASAASARAARRSHRSRAESNGGLRVGERPSGRTSSPPPGRSPLRAHVVSDRQLDPGDACYGSDPERASPAAAELSSRRLGVEDLFLLNSTSGTTGLPKCVTHHQARWFHF
ncbi:MAG TPA: class I adenylate-forming enzyme family protein, partial [Myxococcota bacterium]|nr:class I adenylate-forming enzyme family protein [Myxococcota bacterium]